jgi:hypothetical protein
MADAAAKETINKQIVDAEAERQLQIEKQTKGIEGQGSKERTGLPTESRKTLGELKQRVETAGDLEKKRVNLRTVREGPKAPVLPRLSYLKA